MRLQPGDRGGVDTATGMLEEVPGVLWVGGVPLVGGASPSGGSRVEGGSSGRV